MNKALNIKGLSILDHSYLNKELNYDFGLVAGRPGHGMSVSFKRIPKVLRNNNADRK